MSDFDAIDALLAASGPEAELPPVAERRALREALHLSQAQVARAIGVSPTTVGGWESGREPTGEIRDKYAYFLGAARERTEPEAEPERESSDGSATDVADADAHSSADSEAVPLARPEPCVLCGRPATEQVEGFPQHLDPAQCAPATPAPEPTRPTPAPEPTRPAPAPATRTVRTPGRGERIVPVGRRVQAASDVPDLIGDAVSAALARADGDVDAAAAALLKRAIPDAMALLDETRKGGRYDIVAHPWIPDVLRKQSAKGADQVWEGRPKWARPELPEGAHEVIALDINGAYLSALKTHLPIGQLEHSAGFDHDRRRAGVHLVTPPEWHHDAVLPNPLGNRDEPGPLWVTEPTLRLLLRLSGPKYGLCDPPEIHESYTSGATEGLLEKFRVALKDARDRAISEGDEVTLEYVKAMYSKFVSTMGESNYNRELYRPDWMHLIRSQAFTNLWMKAFKAYDEGLTVVRAMGTDELHVIGDWQSVFPEGRGVAEVKVKDRYTVGRDGAAQAEQGASSA
ncbi:helix-turn-helix domain-containing protein [Streptomyces kanamyceticus]|uniref:Helix-turn-helix domain-containing protein n=1 Tax=Streptomyces kanamyceticus TaxID=1967 RepID=A0A5J6GAL2_STRKN|nr:helix-turn-helix domain-containing protein [Streptomyces kanamyceticus]QEU90995.1 helix-turn-helix domain-containing protein [Streptomyces kanamyceticus]